MKHYGHDSILTKCASIQSEYPIKDLEMKVFHLTAAVAHLQAHNAHLQDVLRANNISMPDNLNTP